MDIMLYSYLDERFTVKWWKKMAMALNIFAHMKLNLIQYINQNCMNNKKKPISRYQFLVNKISSTSKEWMQHNGRTRKPAMMGGRDGRGAEGLGRLTRIRRRSKTFCPQMPRDLVWRLQIRIRLLSSFLYSLNITWINKIINCFYYKLF